MKTKAVYVVVSKESDIYLEQAWVSAYSLKCYNPDIEVIFLTDSGTYKRINSSTRELLETVDVVKAIDTPPEISQKAKSRYIKTSMRRYIEGAFLFLDSDTVIVAPLDEIDMIQCDIGCVLDLNVALDKHIWRKETIAAMYKYFSVDVSLEPAYYNTGVILVKDTELSYQFFELWHRVWFESYSKKDFVFDQPNFFLTDISLGHIAKNIGDVYNYQILAGVRYLNSSKIIHFFNKQWLSKKVMFHDFFKEETYLKVKNKGVIDEDIQRLIKNCKSSFEAPLFIADKKQYTFLAMPQIDYLYSQFEENKIWVKYLMLFLKIKRYLYFKREKRRGKKKSRAEARI